MSYSSSSRYASDKRCFCGNPCRIYTSTTDDNPGRKFRTCANFYSDKERCKLWEWVDDQKQESKWKKKEYASEDVSSEMRIIMLENEMNLYKVMMDQEVKKLKDELGDLKKKLNLQSFIVYFFVIVFAIKGFLGM